MAETDYEFVENVGFQPIEEPVEEPPLFSFPETDSGNRLELKAIAPNLRKHGANTIAKTLSVRVFGDANRGIEGTMGSDQGAEAYQFFRGQGLNDLQIIDGLANFPRESVDIDKALSELSSVPGAGYESSMRDLARYFGEEIGVDYLDIAGKQGARPEDLIQLVANVRRPGAEEEFGGQLVRGSIVGAPAAAAATTAFWATSAMGPYVSIPSALLAGLTVGVAGSLMEQAVAPQDPAVGKQARMAGKAGRVIGEGVPFLAQPPVLSRINNYFLNQLKSKLPAPRTSQQLLEGPAGSTVARQAADKPLFVDPKGEVTAVNPYIGDFLKAAQKNPKLYYGVETGMVGSSAVGSAIAEQMYPGQVLPQLGFELGVPAGAFLTANFVIPYLRNKLPTLKGMKETFSPEAVEQRAGTALRAALINLHEDPDKLIQKLESPEFVKVFNAAKDEFYEKILPQWKEMSPEQLESFGINREQQQRFLTSGELPVFGLTPAQVADSYGLGVLERAAAKLPSPGATDPKAPAAVPGLSQQRQNIQNENSLKTLIESLVYIGNPEALQEAGRLRQHYFEQKIQQRINQATKKAQFAVDKLPRADPDQERYASRVIFDNLMVALKQIREQESKLWEKIPMTVEAGGDDLAATIQRELDKTTEETIRVGGFPKLALEIAKRFEEDPTEASRRGLQESLNLLRNRKQVIPPDKEKGEWLDRVVYNDPEEDLMASLQEIMPDEVTKVRPAKIKGLFNLDDQTRKDFSGGRLRRIDLQQYEKRLEHELNNLPEEQAKDPITFKELLDWRSQFLLGARYAAEGKANAEPAQARLFSEFAQAALRDMEALVDDPNIDPRVVLDISKARTFSRALNDYWTRAFPGEALATTGAGSTQIVPELLSKKILSQGGNDTYLRIEQINSAMRFLLNPEGALSGPPIGARKQSTGELKQGPADEMFDQQGVVRSIEEDLFDNLSEAEMMAISERLNSTIQAERVLLEGMAGRIVDKTTGKVQPQALADFVNDYSPVIDLFPGLKRDLQNVEMTQARLKEVTSGEVTRENQVDRYINNFFKNLTGENVAVSFGDILGVSSGLQRLDRGANASLELKKLVQLARGAVEKSRSDATLGTRGFAPESVSATREGKAAPQRLTVGEVDNAIRSSIFDQAFVYSGGTESVDGVPNIRFDKLQDFFFGRRQGGRPSVVTQLRQADLISSVEGANLRKLIDAGMSIQKKLETGGDNLLQELQAEGDMMVELLTRISGAEAGSRMATMLGFKGGLIAPAAGSKAAQKIVEKIPLGNFTKILREAVSDPQKMALLLRKGTDDLSPNQSRNFNKQVNAFLQGANISLAEGIGEEIMDDDELELSRAMPQRSASMEERRASLGLDRPQASVSPPMQPPAPQPPILPAPDLQPTPPAPSAASPQMRQQYAQMFPFDTASDVIRQQGGIASLRQS